MKQIKIHLTLFSKLYLWAIIFIFDYALAKYGLIPEGVFKLILPQLSRK